MQSALVGAILAGAATIQAQERLASWTLAPAIARIAEPFSSVIGMHERDDGRVVVFDARESALSLIDPVRGTSQRLGREGGGPGEYLLPIAVIGLRGDTTLVADAAKRAFHVIAPDGTVRSTLPWPEEVGLGLANVRGADDRGRVYFVGDGWATATRGIGAAVGYAIGGDSVPFLRWDRRSGRVEALAQLRITSPGDDQQRRTAIRSNAVPFASRDDASVARDGRVVIARATPFAIDLLDVDGRLLPGAPLPFAPARVTEDDRQAVRQSRRGSRFIATGESGGRPDLSTDPLWDEFKPPFPFGRGVQTAPDGIAWVHLLGAHADSTTRYLLFDARGILKAQMTLPARSRVAAFGAGGVWLAREDEDGLIWLSKHPLPPAG